MEKALKNEIMRYLAIADLLGLTVGMTDGDYTLEKGLEDAYKEVKRIRAISADNIEAIRIVKTEDDLIVWLYTEPEFGAALNLKLPYCSEWGYLPHHDSVPVFPWQKV